MTDAVIIIYSVNLFSIVKEPTVRVRFPLYVVPQYFCCFWQVAWSYFKRSLDYKSARGRASSNAENQEQYMIAVTNVV